MTLSRRLALAALIVSAACGGDSSDHPWTTSVDDSGDTIIVRTVGDVPAALASTVVPELKIGALDGPPELMFGTIGYVVNLTNGGLLVYDDQEHQIRLYDAQGAFVRNVGRKGGGPGEYEQINGIAQAANGDIVVWDATHSRVNRYRESGDYVGQFRALLSSWFTSGALHSDRQGRLMLWNPIPIDTAAPEKGTRTAYIRVDSLGTVLDTLMPPVWPAPDMLMAERREGGGRVSRTGTGVPWISSGSTTPDVNGGYITGPGNEYVFYVVRDGQKVLKVERSFTPVPVSETERTERRAQIEQMMRRLDPSWSWTGPGIPASKPAYQSLRVDDDGRIWVRVSTAGEPIPAEEIAARPAPPAGQPAPIRLSTREPVAYDVYAPTGELLGRVNLPPRTNVMRVAGNAAWGVWRDDDDVNYAVRFRIQPALGSTGDRAGRELPE